MGFCFRQWINVLQGWVFIFRFGMAFSGVGFPFTSHRSSTLAKQIWDGRCFSRIQGAVGFGFSVERQCFSRLGFYFLAWDGVFRSEFSIFTPPYSSRCNLFWGWSFFTDGLWEEKEAKVVMVVLINWKFEIIKVKCCGMLVGPRGWGGLPHVKVVQKVVGEGVASELPTRERLETKQTSIIQSTHMTLHHAQPIKNPKRQKS